MALKLVAIAAAGRGASPRDPILETDAPLSAQLIEPANWLARQFDRGAFDRVSPGVATDLRLLQLRLMAWSRGARDLESHPVQRGAAAPPASSPAPAPKLVRVGLAIQRAAAPPPPPAPVAPTPAPRRVGLVQRLFAWATEPGPWSGAL